MIITALVLQTWFDIAIQYTGSVTNAYAIAFANDGRSITDDPEAGEQILIPNEILISRKEVQYLESKQAIPATGMTIIELEIISPELGIGSMTIGSTFIVR